MIQTFKSLLVALMFAAMTFVVAAHTMGRTLAGMPVCDAPGCVDASRS